MQPCLWQCVICPYQSGLEMMDNWQDAYRHCCTILNKHCGELAVSPSVCAKAVEEIVWRSYYHDSRLRAMTSILLLAAMGLEAESPAKKSVPKAPAPSPSNKAHSDASTSTPSNEGIEELLKEFKEMIKRVPQNTESGRGFLVNLLNKLHVITVPAQEQHSSVIDALEKMKDLYAAVNNPRAGSEDALEQILKKLDHVHATVREVHNGVNNIQNKNQT